MNSTSSKPAKGIIFLIILNIITIFGALFIVNEKNRTILRLEEDNKYNLEFYEACREDIDNLQINYELAKDSLESYKKLYEYDVKEKYVSKPKIKDTNKFNEKITNTQIIQSPTIKDTFFYYRLIYFDSNVVVRYYNDSLYINTNDKFMKYKIGKQ
jgi:hypothetical protein